MERLAPGDLDEVLTALLIREPAGLITAIGDNGLFVPMPTAVPLHGHTVIDGASSALEMVSHDDLRAVIETWEQAVTHGAAKGVFHPVNAPGTEMEAHFVDARHRYGAFLGIIFGAPSTTSTEAAAEMRPRYGVMHKNELAIVSFADPGIQRMLGWTEAELVGRRSLELVHPEDHSRAIANYLDLIGHPGATRRVRLRHQKADGSWLWLEVTNTNLLNDQGHVLGECVDISEETAATEALRANEELLRRLTDALPLGVVQIDPDGRITYCNGGTEIVLGRPVAAPERLDEVLPGTALSPALEQALVGTDGDLEMPVEHADGSVRQVHVRLRALPGPDGGVTGAIVCLNDITDAARLRDELAHRATYDALTGCLSRLALLERIEALLAEGAQVTALFIDLDGFKGINDRFGHAVGDALLTHVAQRLSASIGDAGFVGRLGGDEFLAVLPDADEQRGRAAVDMISAAIGEPLLIDGAVLTARGSVGLALWDRNGDADALIAAADEQMYRVKVSRREAR